MVPVSRPRDKPLAKTNNIIIIQMVGIKPRISFAVNCRSGAEAAVTLQVSPPLAVLRRSGPPLRSLLPVALPLPLLAPACRQRKMRLAHRERTKKDYLHFFPAFCFAPPPAAIDSLSRVIQVYRLARRWAQNWIGDTSSQRSKKKKK